MEWEAEVVDDGVGGRQAEIILTGKPIGSGTAFPCASAVFLPKKPMPLLAVLQAENIFGVERTSCQFSSYSTPTSVIRPAERASAVPASSSVSPSSMYTTCAAAVHRLKGKAGILALKRSAFLPMATCTTVSSTRAQSGTSSAALYDTCTPKSAHPAGRTRVNLQLQ